MVNIFLNFAPFIVSPGPYLTSEGLVKLVITILYTHYIDTWMHRHAHYPPPPPQPTLVHTLPPSPIAHTGTQETRFKVYSMWCKWGLMSSDVGLTVYLRCAHSIRKVYIYVRWSYETMLLALSWEFPKLTISRLILLHSIDSRIQYKLASLCYNCLNNLPCKVRSTNTRIFQIIIEIPPHQTILGVRVRSWVYFDWGIFTPGSLLCNGAGPSAPAWKNGTTKSVLLLPNWGAGIVQYLERLTRGPGGTRRRENFRLGQLSVLYFGICSTPVSPQ